MSMHSTDRFASTKRLIRAAMLLATLSPVSTVFAQYGASPSQTGLFFDDLRTRVSTSGLGDAGVRGGQAVYDYDRGSYTEDEREMGQSYVHSAVEAARQMGQPSYNSGVTGSARGASDYTFYSGQYTSPSTFFAPTYVSDPFMGGRRNLKMGGVNIGFGLYGGLEYNDNVTRSSTNPVEDFIGTLLLNVDANYQVTRHNRLTLTTSLGFDHYFEHPEVAPYGSGDFVLNVLPGSSIAFDLKIGPVFVVLYDRMSVRPAVRNDFGLSANQIFGVFQNDAGMAAQWAINSDWTLSANYMHSNSRALEDQFDVFNRDMDSIYGNLTWSPSGTWSLSLQGGMSWVRYPQQYNNDGVLANLGLVFATPLGENTFLRVAGGLQDFNFDDPPAFSRTVTQKDIDQTNLYISNLNQAITSGRLTEAELKKANKDLTMAQTLLTNQNLVLAAENAQYNSNNRDTSDLTDYYYNVTLSNQLNASINHVLSFGHESALNNISNYVTADYINYGIGIVAWRGSRLSLSGYYENAKMSGGLQAENLKQHGFDAYFGQMMGICCMSRVSAWRRVAMRREVSASWVLASSRAS